MSSSLDHIDLDINNYSIQDILVLFKLTSIKCTESDLASAKRNVMRMHPDKSHKDPKFFLFYIKAYKILLNTWKHTNIYEKNISELKDITYNTNNLYEKDEHIPQKPTKELSSKEFNELFENSRVGSSGLNDEDEDQGYGKWLKSMDDIIYDKECGNKVENTKDAMNNFSQLKKNQCFDLIDKSSIGAYNNTNTVSVYGNDDPFQSGSSGQLAYQDLRQAYTNTLIPVDDTNHKTYNSLDEYVSDRDKDLYKPLKENNTNMYKLDIYSDSE